MHDISEKIPDVATSVNLRSIREMLKLSSKLKNEFPMKDEMAVIRESVITFFTSQLTAEVICRVFSSIQSLIIVFIAKRRAVGLGERSISQL